MAVFLRHVNELPERVDAVAVCVFEDLVPAAEGEVIDAADATRLGFRGKLGETCVLAGNEDPLVVLVGLGPEERFGLEPLRRASAAFTRATAKCAAVTFPITGLEAEDRPVEAVAEAVALGAALAAYRFDRFKSEPEAEETRGIYVVGADTDASAVAVGLRRGELISDAVRLARDLVNTPAGDLTPRRFAEIAGEVVATSGGLSISVLTETEILAERLGGLAGVAAGSAEPPRFIKVSYEPRHIGPQTPTIALVGKGITFDSGGLSLKNAAGMMTMKTDMSGAAAVLATLGACSDLGVAARVIAYMPVTENMPGGRAIKPGDVLTIRNAKTIEVLNTDAEGRLVLADALSLAVEDAPDAIIDLATFTGACVTALGMRIAGLFGNDDRLIESVRAAADRAGEAVWPLPLPAGYRPQIDSDVADMKNIGATGGQAGAIAAALLLAEFVGDVPWVHLDIAGTARSEEDKGYLKKGGTGFGVRTLIELLTHYTPFGGTVEATAAGIEVFR
jgi:leucyl aminopeptidase